MNKKTFNISKLGNFEVKKFKQSKKMRIILKKDNSFIVTIPQKVSYFNALEFVKQNKNWIIEKQNIQKKQIQKRYFTEETNFKTREHELYINSWNRTSVSITIGKNKIDIKYPVNIDIKDDRIQKSIIKGIEKAMKIEAEKYLSTRIKDLAEEHNFKYTHYKVNSAKTRWGSCSSNNNLNFSCYIVQLPNYLIDYIILHELTHTIEKNHGKGFWNLLQQVCANAKIYDKELKKHKIGLNYERNHK